MKNNYEIRGEVTVIFLKNRKYGEIETLIDTNDLPRAMELGSSWYAKRDATSDSFYVYGNVRSNGKWTKAKLHRWIMQANTHLVIDHINHDTLDNRRSINLREITNAQNGQNRKSANTNSISGIRGVRWNKLFGKWEARLIINGKSRNVGCFEKLEQAETAIKSARAELMPFSYETLGR